MAGDSSSLLRVLYASPFVPLPLTSGGRLLTHGHLRGLAARGHRLTLIVPVRRDGDERSLETMSGFLTPLPVPVPSDRERRFGPLFGFLRGSSFRVERHRFPEVERAVAEALRLDAWDIVVLDSLFTAYLMSSIRRLRPRLPIVLVEHNVESRLFLRYAAVAARGVRAAAPLEEKRIRKVESEALRGADAIVALSEEDRRDMLRLAPDASVTVVPPGTETHPGETIPGPDGQERVLFLGTFRWPPNREAARWLAEKVWPAVRSRLASAELVIAGEAPPVQILSLARSSSGIRVIGDVENAAALVRSCALSVVPIRVGGGVRLKILEAFANERAVVTTTLGCEGLPVKHGEHLLAADTPATFAEAIILLLRDDRLRARVAGNARRLAEERFGWDRIAREIEAVLLGAARKRD